MPSSGLEQQHSILSRLLRNLQFILTRGHAFHGIGALALQYRSIGASNMTPYESIGRVGDVNESKIEVGLLLVEGI